jgi:hypothetical protein
MRAMTAAKGREDSQPTCPRSSHRFAAAARPSCRWMPRAQLAADQVPAGGRVEATAQAAGVRHVVPASAACRWSSDSLARA